jgi:hypothetical protein
MKKFISWVVVTCFAPDTIGDFLVDDPRFGGKLKSLKAYLKINPSSRLVRLTRLIMNV